MNTSDALIPAHPQGDDNSPALTLTLVQECWGPLLMEPWVLDIDTTIKPIYGHQDAAKKGYNPAKPGRPSLACHSYFIGSLRVCLDVEVESGDRCAARHGQAGLWRIIDALPKVQRPVKVRRAASELPLLESGDLVVEGQATHEFMVLITKLRSS